MHPLAGLALDQVVDGSHHDQLAGAAIHLHREQGPVGLAHPFGGGVGAHRQHLNAGGLAVGGSQQGGAVFSGEAWVAQTAVDGGQQAPHHRHQVRGELQLDLMARHPASQLLNLTGVAVAHHPIGSNRLGAFRQQQVLLGSPTTTGGAGFGVDNDAGGVDQPLLQERQQPQQ